MNNNLIVKSNYLTSTSYDFYLKHFMSSIDYIYLANNYNKYNLVLTNETFYDLQRIKNILNVKKKNPEFDLKNLFFVCSSNEHINWCENLGFSHKQLSDININFEENYIPQIVEKPTWAFKDHVLGLEYFFDSHTNIQILHLEGLEHNWNILSHLTNDKYTFITLPCYYHKWLCENATNTIFTLNPTLNKKNIIFLSPDFDNILWSHEYGFSAIMCNHNCFLDYNKFSFNENETVQNKPIYSMVMNCRPELWKQPFLAENVEDLAYIKGSTYGNALYDYSKLKCKFMNEELISMEQVMDVYNKSYCGGIFSKLEGACYSSSEYLLCGLPVISVNCRGGRETWYTKTNSIIIEENDDVEITKNKIVDAVKLCKYNMENNIFNKEQIRNEHIVFSNEMRSNFINYTQSIFDTHNIEINAKEQWNKMYFHKLKHNIKSNEFIKILRKDNI